MDKDVVLKQGDILEIDDKHYGIFYGMNCCVDVSGYKIIILDDTSLNNAFYNLGNRFSDTYHVGYITLSKFIKHYGFISAKVITYDDFIKLQYEKLLKPTVNMSQSYIIQPELNEFIYHKKKDYVIVKRYFRPNYYDEESGERVIRGDRGITCIFKIDHHNDEFHCIFSICKGETFSKEKGILKARERGDRKITGHYHSDLSLQDNLYYHLQEKENKTQSEQTL